MSLKVGTVGRYLRSTKTGLYYSRGGWVKEANRAEDFRDLKAAMDEALEQRLPDVELVVQIGDVLSARYNVTLLLNSSFGRRE